MQHHAPNNERINRESSLPPPPFPDPKFSEAFVEHEEGVGSLLFSRFSTRRFFCPESSPCVQTQFAGSVRRCFEAWVHGRDFAERDEEDAEQEEEEESSIVCLNGRAFQYFPARPMALKTCRIEVLRLEACYQQRELGELTGEDPIKEVAALQLLQSHANVEELEEAMMDDTNLYKVTPWYEGGELFDLAPLPEDSAKLVFAQLLDALEFIHSRGVCHRDISLENVLMDTRVPNRSSAYRSSSVSSIGSCISVASSSFSEICTNSGSSSSCCGSTSTVGGCFSPIAKPTGPVSSPASGREEEGLLKEVSQNGQRAARNGIDGVGPSGGNWMGRPRLCDFGMSVRIPKFETGKRASVTPQGRCGKNTCVAPEVFYDQVFDAEAVDTWSLGTTLFMALLGVQPWEEVGDYKFQAIAEGKNLEVVLEGWRLRDQLSQDAVDLMQALLTADPAERLSDTKAILSHPWFKS